MLEKIPTPYSVDAADAADRLRLIKCDLRLIDDDVLERDRKGGPS